MHGMCQSNFILFHHCFILWNKKLTTVERSNFSTSDKSASTESLGELSSEWFLKISWDNVDLSQSDLEGVSSSIDPLEGR